LLLRYLGSGHEAFNPNLGNSWEKRSAAGVVASLMLKLRLSFHVIIRHDSILEGPPLAADASMSKRERLFLAIGYFDFACSAELTTQLNF
jgi:hypothetical protein